MIFINITRIKNLMGREHELQISYQMEWREVLEEPYFYLSLTVSLFLLPFSRSLQLSSNFPNVRYVCNFGCLISYLSVRTYLNNRSNMKKMKHKYFPPGIIRCTTVQTPFTIVWMYLYFPHLVENSPATASQWRQHSLMGSNVTNVHSNT